MLRRMLNFTRTKAVSVLRPASRWSFCLVLIAACGGDAASTPAAPPPLPAAPAKVEPPAPVEPALPLPIPEPEATPAAQEGEKAADPSAAKAKANAAKEDEVVSKKGAAADEPEGKKKAPEPTPVAKPDTKADPKAEPAKGETLTAKVTPPTPAPKPAPTPAPVPAPEPKADTKGTASKPVMQPPPPVPPSPVAYEMPSSAHVRIEAPKGLEADLAKDTRMKPWLQKSVTAATKCYEIEAKTTPKLAGTIEVGIVMHENDRPDAAIKKLPPQLSGVFACVSGAMMKSRMPLFVGKEGQKYTARVVFKP